MFFYTWSVNKCFLQLVTSAYYYNYYYITVFLSVALDGCANWPLNLKEEYGLMVFENRVLRRVFWPKGVEVMAGLRELHGEELRDLDSVLNIMGLIKQGGRDGRCMLHY